MYHRMIWMSGMRLALCGLCTALVVIAPVMADEANAPRGGRLDPDKLAGLNLPNEEQFVPPEVVLAGKHQPRGEILHYGDQLIVEVFEDGPVTFRFDEPFVFDEFIMVQSGKLIMTGSDGESQEFVQGDSLIIPKGFTGTFKTLGNYRELIVIEREGYEAAYGAPEE